MKNRKMIWVVGMLMVCLLPSAIFAQQTEWQTTSPMIQNSKSTYQPPITDVGATMAVSEATTTETYSPTRSQSTIRRSGNWGDGLDEYGQGPSPIGDAVLPLLLMAIAFVGITAIRRKRKTNENAA